MPRGLYHGPRKKASDPGQIGRQAALLRLRREGIFRRRDGLLDLQAGGQRRPTSAPIAYCYI